MRYLVFIICCLFSTASLAAWDDGQGVKTGVISSVDVTGGTNYGFRVYLGGSPKMCAGGATWAYLNNTDSNYDVYVSMLLTAFAAGLKVTIFSNTKSGSSFCQIGYIRAYQ